MSVPPVEFNDQSSILVMHRRSSLATLALLLIAGVPIRGLVAQRATDAPAAGVRAAPAESVAPCTYMTCALRVEGGFLRGPQLVPGPDGTDVAGLNACQTQCLHNNVYIALNVCV